MAVPHDARTGGDGMSNNPTPDIRETLQRMKPCAKCGHGKSLHLTHGCRKTWTKRGQTFAGIGTYTEWCRCDGYQEKEQEQ